MSRWIVMESFTNNLQQSTLFIPSTKFLESIGSVAYRDGGSVSFLTIR